MDHDANAHTTRIHRPVASVPPGTVALLSRLPGDCLPILAVDWRATGPATRQPGSVARSAGHQD